MNVSLILFDGYGTLFDQAMQHLFDTCQRMVDDLNLPLTRDAFLEHWDRYFFPMIREGDFVTFRHAHIAGLERVFEDLDVQANPAPYIDDLVRAFGDVPAYADVHPALSALDGLPTGVVSNADHGHLQAALAKNRLEFEHVISSESARCYKPNPDIFFHALDHFNCRPEEALYVGDSQEDDIVGARRAGLRIAWLNRDRAKRRGDIPQPDFEIGSLLEVPGIVGKG